MKFDNQNQQLLSLLVKIFLTVASGIAIFILGLSFGTELSTIDNHVFFNGRWGNLKGGYNPEILTYSIEITISIVICAILYLLLKFGISVWLQTLRVAISSLLIAVSWLNTGDRSQSSGFRVENFWVTRNLSYIVFSLFILAIIMAVLQVFGLFQTIKRRSRDDVKYL
jgi:hypothetical protein